MRRKEETVGLVCGNKPDWKFDVKDCKTCEFGGEYPNISCYDYMLYVIRTTPSLKKIYKEELVHHRNWDSQSIDFLGQHISIITVIDDIVTAVQQAEIIHIGKMGITVLDLGYMYKYCMFKDIKEGRIDDENVANNVEELRDIQRMQDIDGDMLANAF